MAEQSFFHLSERLITKLQLKPVEYAGLRAKYNSDKSPEELFSYMWDLEEAHQILTPNFVTSGKSEKLATRLGKEANFYFNEGKDDKALELYNRSIMTAPHPIIKKTVESRHEDDYYEFPPISTEKYGGVDEARGTALAMGFGNRSALMMKLKLYKNCLEDINLAFKYGYPEDRRHRLEDRRRRCLAAQRNLLEMGDLPENDLPSSSGACGGGHFGNVKRRHSFSDMLSGLQELMASLKVSQEPKENQPLKRLLAFKKKDSPRVNESNKSIPAFSSAVELSYSPSQGRYIVAARDIRPGEVIGVERAHSASVDPKNLPMFCSTCLSLCLVPLPCPSCSKVIFCSESCRTKGLAEDHWLECRILPTTITLEISELNLVYKMLKTYTYVDLNMMLQQLNKERVDIPPEKMGTNRHGIYSSTSYQPIYYLYDEKINMAHDMLFVKCQLAFVLTKLLHQSERFFVDPSSGEPVTPSRYEMIQTGAVMLSHLIKFSFNPFEIKEFRVEEPVGTGMFSAMSLINHSCNPSTKNFTLGRDMFIRALRPMKAGDEVTISYTIDFERKVKSDRAKELKKYNFTCTCEACENDWPVYSKMQVVIWKESSERYEVQRQVLEKIVFSLSNAYHTDAKIRSREPVSQEEYDKLCEANELLHAHLERPCQNVCDVQNTMWQCFLEGF